ncbi:hypothetical protein MXB_2058 [Myxobolus squamalis]|nr:hypothetical protein MXB_2058 [Myxobolus squamalis]
MVGELDSRIRCAKSLHLLIRQVYTQYTSTSRNQKFEKTRFSFPNDENIMKRYLQACDTIIVFKTDDIPPAIRSAKSTKIPVVSGKKNSVPPPATPRTAISTAHNVGGPLCQVDQEYRLRYRLSSLYKPTYDLLPSPSLFTLHVTGINEASKFLQEVALEKMTLYTRQYIDKTAKNAEKMVIARVKVCLQCKTDFSPIFICIDQQKSKFICDQCTTKQRRVDAANLDILSIYADNSPSPPFLLPPVLEENGSVQCAPAQNRVHVKNLVHKTSAIVSENSSQTNQSISQQKKMVEFTSTAPRHFPLSVHRLPFPMVQTVPRLIVHGNNPLRDCDKYPPTRHDMFPSYSTAHTIQTGPRFFSAPQIPATQALYPVFVPISSLSNISVHNNGVSKKVHATTIHYRPQREILYPNIQTPVLRENLPANPTSSLHPKY